MKFVVNEMPTRPDDCLFCNYHWNYYVCKVHSTAMQCPYFSPERNCEPECPFLISMQDLKNNA